MSKIVALDLGDQWVGIAMSDQSRIIARPYKTVGLADLEIELKKLIAHEAIETVIIGYPKTMKGTHSEQTNKIVGYKEKLELHFPENQFVLWDERLSSKRAQNIQKTSSKEERLKSHAIAAAFILDSYLMFLSHQNNQLFGADE